MILLLPKKVSAIICFFKLKDSIPFNAGLATLGGEPPLELDAASFWSHALDGAVYVSENLLIFLFAGVGLDLCFKLRILSPFPIDRSISETDKI